jgi:hypothetical protein
VFSSLLCFIQVIYSRRQESTVSFCISAADRSTVDVLYCEWYKLHPNTHTLAGVEEFTNPLALCMNPSSMACLVKQGDRKPLQTWFFCFMETIFRHRTVVYAPICSTPSLLCLHEVDCVARASNFALAARLNASVASKM